MLRVSIEPAPPAAVEAASTAKRIMASVKVPLQPYLFVGVVPSLMSTMVESLRVFVALKPMTPRVSGSGHGTSNI
jgi:hypothetical protein